MLEPGQNVKTVHPLTIRGKFIPPGTCGQVLSKYSVPHFGEGVFQYDVKWNGDKLPNDIMLPVLEGEVEVIG